MLYSEKILIKGKFDFAIMQQINRFKNRMEFTANRRIVGASKKGEIWRSNGSAKEEERDRHR